MPLSTQGRGFSRLWDFSLWLYVWFLAVFQIVAITSPSFIHLELPKESIRRPQERIHQC